MAQFTDFIPQNIAPANVKRIGVYNAKGKRLFSIPIGNLAPRVNGEKLYSFGALSDIHVVLTTGAEDFQKALTYLNETEDVEFTCICGDLTQNATADEFTQYKTLVDTYSPNTPVYAIAGNHEAYDGVPVTTEKIKPYTGQPFYYSFTRGDDVFIMCGCYTADAGNIFTTEELQWLYETLEENRNKRCFVFQHVFPWGDSGNANDAYAYGDLFAGTKGDVFKSLMQHYKNTIFFHGHSHMKFDLQGMDEKANYSEAFGYRSVHIPSLCVPRDIVGSSLTNLYAESEGYVVDAYEDGIHLRGRDFVKGEFLPIANYWIDTTLQTIDAGTYADSTGTIETRIPEEYQQVEWIGVSGTQYINTGISPQSDNVVYESEWVETARERYAVVFGSTNANYSAKRNKWSGNHYHPVYGALYSATAMTDQLAQLSGIIVANEKNALKTTIKDGTLTLELNGRSATGEYSGTIMNETNIGLFANIQTSKVSEYSKYTQMYYWRMTDNGVVVRNMIPCYRKADGVVGMYDTISKQFFVNAGSGEFSKGADILTDDTTAVLGKAILGKAILGRQ